MATNGKPRIDDAGVSERKALMNEIKQLQKRLQGQKAKCQQQKNQLTQHRTHELALMQTNRMLADMVKSYADREAVLMANWRTFHQAFAPPPEPDVVDLDRE